MIHLVTPRFMWWWQSRIQNGEPGYSSIPWNMGATVHCVAAHMNQWISLVSSLMTLKTWPWNMKLKRWRGSCQPSWSSHLCVVTKAGWRSLAFLWKLTLSFLFFFFWHKKPAAVYEYRIRTAASSPVGFFNFSASPAYLPVACPVPLSRGFAWANLLIAGECSGYLRTAHRTVRAGNRLIRPHCSRLAHLAHCTVTRTQNYDV